MIVDALRTKMEALIVRWRQRGNTACAYELEEVLTTLQGANVPDGKESAAALPTNKPPMRTSDGSGSTLQGVQEPPLLKWAAELVRVVCFADLSRNVDDEVAEPVRKIAMEMKNFADSRSVKENSDARSELHETCGTAASGFSPREAPSRTSADDVAELDRQIADYKARCDRGETVSGSDARWLLNEMIYQRDHSSARAPQEPLAAKLLERIASYFGNGGAWNPEMMEHVKVRDLLFDVRDYIQAQEARPAPSLDIDKVIQEVAELPDRTSPDDWPAAMLVTADELRAILVAALPSPPAAHAAPTEETK